MFKGLGFAGFAIFLLLSTLLLSSAPGGGFVLGVAFAVGLGTVSLFLLNVGSGNSGILKEISGASNLDPRELLNRIEEISTVIRQDGLLALESKRKEIRDPNLNYLLKRILDGFEGKDLIPWVLNQRDARMEGLRDLSDSLDRFLSQIPGLGLLSSLILMSGVLSRPERSKDLIGIAHVFLPFLIALGVQMLLDSEIGKRWNEARTRMDHYYAVLEAGVSGIQSGMNPELLSDRLRARIQTGRA